MKRYIFPATLVLLSGIISCKKSSTSPSIVGKWGIINDSTSFVGRDAAASYQSNYTGQTEDYFDFRKDGNMYVKEGVKLDTMAYEILAGNQVRCVPSPGLTEAYTTSEITSTTATFKIALGMPTGQLTKVIHLRK